MEKRRCAEPSSVCQGGEPVAAASVYIDATKKFNISLTEKRFVHFRLSRQACSLEDRTTIRFTDPYWG
ncbi:hypothetical protein GC56T3_3208 [Geobacillus sp. C56-T3]|nr:hypothetical protein GC56T3_3208 [Geobacillus sp. C56-T3]